MYWNTPNDFFERKPSNYWKNLMAPLPKEAQEARYMLCCLFGIIIIMVSIYQFQTDVLYELQYQIPIISKTYYMFTSNSLCYVLAITGLIGIIFKRWWYWFINNLWVTLLVFLKTKMEAIDLYKNAFNNGIIWVGEYFNYNINFYLYKVLTPEQVEMIFREELKTRYSSISILTYNDCRYGHCEDYWVNHFFDEFVLDYNDVKSSSRIIAQLDIFQKNKITQGKTYMDLRDLEYIRDHPLKYYFCKFSDSVGYFFSEYTGHLILGSVFGVILVCCLYYNLVEDPNIKKNLLALWQRWVDFGFNPNINVKPRWIEDICSAKLHIIFGKDDPEKYLSNLSSLLKQNENLMKVYTDTSFVDAGVLKTLGPELAKKAYETMLPQTLNQMLPQMLETQQLCVQITEKIAKKMNSPFEQFEVIVLQKISLFGIDLSITNLTLFLAISLSVIAVFSVLIYASISLIPKYWQSVIEIFYSFIFSMLIDQAGKKAKVYFPAIFSVFFFILVNNLLGLIPLSFAVTSHVVITFCLGFGFFVAWVIVAFKTLGFKVFKMFWPTNVPLWLRPLLMVVEILSFSLRPFSLSIRLFVNMLAGHVLLHLVGGSVVLVFSQAAIFSFIPFILLLAVFCLELGIAFLQAYIFSILLCIYLHDSYHAHH